MAAEEVPEDDMDRQEEPVNRAPRIRRTGEGIAPIGTVRQALQRAALWIDQAREAGHAGGYDSDEDEPTSPTQRYLDEHDAWKEFTNFEKNEVVAIWRPYQDIMAAQRHRGPVAQSSPMDQLIHYMAWLKTNMD